MGQIPQWTVQDNFTCVVSVPSRPDGWWSGSRLSGESAKDDGQDVIIDVVEIKRSSFYKKQTKRSRTPFLVSSSLKVRIVCASGTLSLPASPRKSRNDRRKMYGECFVSKRTNILGSIVTVEEKFFIFANCMTQNKGKTEGLTHF